MGRRIYENGNFVWKYTFGRQDSNMCDYVYRYGIGKYITEEHTEKNDDETYNYTNKVWVVKRTDIHRLQELLTKFSKKTRQQLNEIGMKEVIKFVEKQNDKWKEHFKDDLKNIKNMKSEIDFPYNSSSGGGFTFDIYDIFATKIEKHLSCSFDFYIMTENFIAYMTIHHRDIYNFEDE